MWRKYMFPSIDPPGSTFPSASNGSAEVLEHILSHECCDVDPVNYIEKATPLHLAVKLSDPDLRIHVVQSLLEAGANTRLEIFNDLRHILMLFDSIKNKFGQTALDTVHNNTKLSMLFRRATASQMVSSHDLAGEPNSIPINWFFQHSTCFQTVMAMMNWLQGNKGKLAVFRKDVAFMSLLESSV
jgi:hypothetical protein